MDQLNRQKLPRHIAIIMDGNGRWARQRNLERITGHQEGIESVREIVKFCSEIGIQVLTLYVFSIENWKRPKSEIRALMGLMKRYLQKEMAKLSESNIRLSVIGNILDLPPAIARLLMQAIEKTRDCRGMILNLALSYGGRDEIVQATRAIVEDFQQGKIKTEDLTESLFGEYLFTRGLPDPDLLIRTSGEKRLSNFMLWQMAYTEIYITDVLWPDFKPDHMMRALIDYQNRERRFGLTSDQVMKVAK